MQVHFVFEVDISPIGKSFEGEEALLVQDEVHCVEFEVKEAKLGETPFVENAFKTV